MNWLEEINTHLVMRMRQNLTALNQLGLPVPIRVEFTQAEGEGAPPINEQLPKVSVELYDLLLDLSRVGVNHGTQIRSNITPTLVTLRNPPEPYWLFYQMSILTDSNADLMRLTSQMLTLFPPRSTIHVNDLSGQNPIGLYMELVEYGNPQTALVQRTRNEDRLVRRFRVTFRYKITAELDAQSVTQAHRVLRVIVET